jgi:hypothetical protein
MNPQQLRSAPSPPSILLRFLSPRRDPAFVVSEDSSSRELVDFKRLVRTTASSKGYTNEGACGSASLQERTHTQTHRAQREREKIEKRERREREEREKRERREREREREERERQRETFREKSQPTPKYACNTSKSIPSKNPGTS